MFTELSLGCWLSGHRNLYIYQVLSSKVFFFVSYMQIHVPFIMYCLRLFVVKKEIVYILLNMMLFVGSQSFMFVSATVSEIRELNQKKKKKNYSEIDYFI